MPLTPAALPSLLQRWPIPRRYWIAFSGGLDSTVLLHALTQVHAELKAPLAAVHLHHGLQPLADGWAGHCARLCAELGVAFRRVDLGLTPPPGASIEAFARDARYGALKELIGAKEMLLTAHHRDDQAETLLLQLLRGSGPAGLAAMPELAPFGQGWHGRPLLEFGRAELVEYAEREGLAWVEDPTNAESAFDRNFLRNRVMPLLRSRWPGASRTLSRSARLCAEAQGLIDERAREDLAQAEAYPTDGGRCLGRDAIALPVPPLSCEHLAGLPPPRARAALRLWIRDGGFPLPDHSRLEELRREMAEAAPDRNPLVAWGGVEARRYRGLIHLLPALPHFDPNLELAWEHPTLLELPAGLGRLMVEQAEEGEYGIDPARWQAARRRVGFRRHGLKCRPARREHHRSLKHLLQERGIPPWQRERLPLLFLDGELAAVGDLLICEEFACKGGLRLVWECQTQFDRPTKTSELPTR